MSFSSLTELNDSIVRCRQCPRLVEFREKIAREKRKQFEHWNYWGKPVPGYGSEESTWLIVGLAPAAHGGNRTGRVFTGDKSADFLMQCLHHAGLSNQPTSESREDGLVIHDNYMTPVLKCVPPGDKPTAEELRTCREYFTAEMRFLKGITHVLALGQIAHKSYLRFVRESYAIKMKDFPFGHDRWQILPNGKTLVSAYHPSPRNVNTGRLTFAMFTDLLKRLKRALTDSEFSRSQITT